MNYCWFFIIITFMWVSLYKCQGGNGMRVKGLFINHVNIARVRAEGGGWSKLVKLSTKGSQNVQKLSTWFMDGPQDLWYYLNSSCSILWMNVQRSAHGSTRYWHYSSKEKYESSLIRAEPYTGMGFDNYRVYHSGWINFERLMWQNWISFISYHIGTIHPKTLQTT